MKTKIFPVLVLCTSAVYAGESGWSSSFTPQDISMTLSSGLLLKTHAEELVYAGEDGKLSELDWDTSSANIVNAEINWQFHPKVSFNARGWTTLSKNSSVMNDYDWLSENDRNLVTDWSYHDRTPLNFANEFDLNFNVSLFELPYSKFGAVLGYQQTKYSWTAFGGSSRYSEQDQYGNYIDGSALSIIGEFDPNEAVIGYMQTFKMPYIGLTNQFKYKNLELNTTLKYSQWVDASDHDEHYLRDLTFISEAKNGKYFGAVANLGYWLRPDTKLFTEYAWSEYKHVVGDINQINNVNNQVYTFEDSAGISNKTQRLSVGITYEF